MSRDDTMKRRASFNVTSALANLASHIHEGEEHPERVRREQRNRVLLRGAQLLTTLLEWVGSKDGKADPYAIAVRRPAIVLAAGYMLLLSGRISPSSSRIWLSSADVEALNLPDSSDRDAVTAANAGLAQVAERALNVEELTGRRPRADQTSLDIQLSRDPAVQRASAIVQRISDLSGLDSRTRYNLACFFTTIENIDAALGQLRLAVASDHALAAWAAGDPSLEPLKGNPQFERIINPPAAKPTDRRST